MAYIYLAARRCEDAIIAAKRALDLDLRSALAHWYLGRAYCLEEKWNEAIDALRQSVELSPDLPLFKGDLALALRRAGKSSSARSVLEDVQQAATMHYVRRFTSVRSTSEPAAGNLLCSVCNEQ